MKNTNFSNTTKKMLAALLVLATVISLCGCNSQQKSCNHNYYLSDYSEAGVENGYKEFTCSNCGNSYHEIIPGKSNDVSVHDVPATESVDLTRKKNANLFDFPIYSHKNALGAVDHLVYSADATDVDGWKHSNCYKICGTTSECWVRYELNGKYTTLSGSLFDANESGGSGWLEFFDGDDFLAATPKIDNNTTSAEFEIDITGVKYLTVHFRSTQAGTWMLADKVLMRND